MKERSDAEQTLPRIEVLSLFVSKKLDSLGFEEGFKDVEKWHSPTLMEADIALVPIHKNDHWTLVEADLKTSTIKYYDSIVGKRYKSRAPKLMRKFFEKMANKAGVSKQFKVKIIDQAPVQRNGVDCGVFVCQNAEKIARGVAVNTKQEEMMEARRQMMLELVVGKIIPHKGQAEQLLNRLPEVKMRLNPKKYNPKHDTKKWEKKVDYKQKKREVRGRQNPKDDSRKEIEPECQDHKQNENQRCVKMVPRVKWPKANSNEWSGLDVDMTSRLNIIIGSPLEKAKTQPKLIYEMCKERFGLEERSGKKSQEGKGPSRRQRKCNELRREIKKLNKAYKEAPEEEKEGIKELHDEKLKSLRLKKRAESVRKNRKEFSKNCGEFLSQPYQFSRKVINPKPKGDLKSTKEEVETYLEQVHSSQGLKRESPETIEMLKYALPESPFRSTPPSYKEFCSKLRKSRTKSAPGPNGVPYKVYKRCPGVARLLWQNLCAIWKENKISDSWREANGVFIPKEEGATSVEKFRTISLLNVEGKLFFAMKADRILEYVLANEYIDTSIQKGGIPATSGCLENTAVLSQLIREAKKEKKNLVITWLDIANAYGSIPHSLIIEALQEAHIPGDMVKLIEDYYRDVRIRFATKEYVTEWQKVEKGIITGCTLSVVLFALAMTWIVASVKKVTKGPKLSSGQYQVNSRLFMDDIVTSTETMVQTSSLINKLIEKLDYAGLTAKPEKCRSLVIYKGKVLDKQIKIKGKPVTQLQDKSIKYLGKSYNANLDEKEQMKAIESQVIGDLKKVDRCRLPGRYKAWMLQYMLLPRLMWPLSIYNVPMSFVDRLQNKITASLKKWLGLPRSMSPACLYSKSAKLRFPFSELTEEVKVAKARNLMTLQESDDLHIKDSTISVDGGKKVDTPSEICEAKSRLRMKDIVGIPNLGKEGLGLRKRRYYNNSNKKDKRDLVVKEVRAKEEDRRRVHIASLSKQGASTRWEVPEKRLTQEEIVRMTETRLKFLTKSVYDLLPTPRNKNKWFGTNDNCKLCGGVGTLNHILTGCSAALGRYKWRHDKVLRELGKYIEERIQVMKEEPIPSYRTIVFLREGEKKEAEKPRYRNILDPARDWEMRIDLEKRVKIPPEISVTNMRPDILIISKSSKQMIMVELTVPHEERIEVSGEIKRTKYNHVVEEGKVNGWTVSIWPVEVGCRGFPANSMAAFLRAIGFTGKSRKLALKNLGEKAEEASRMIWLWSNNEDKPSGGQVAVAADGAPDGCTTPPVETSKVWGLRS